MPTDVSITDPNGSTVKLSVVSCTPEKVRVPADANGMGQPRPAQLNAKVPKGRFKGLTGGTTVTVNPI